MSLNDNEITIIHLSDLHLTDTSLKELEFVIENLNNDIKDVLKQNDLEASIICFSGDLIQRGDYANKPKNLLGLSQKYFINPILDNLSLNKDDIFIVPGNHDVDLSKIDEFSEIGLTQELKTSSKISSFLKSGKIKNHSQRIDAINNFIKKYQGNNSLNNGLSYYTILQKNNCSVGIIGLNTAWRYNGKPDDKYNLIIGGNQIEAYLRKISKCSLKICIMHHPTHYLIEEDKKDIEELLTKFDLVLNGHMHDLDNMQISKFYDKTVYDTAGKLYPISKNYNGYSIIKINDLSRECTIFHRKYEKNGFVESSRVSYVLNEFDEPKEIAYKIRKNLKKYFETNIDKSLITYSIDDGLPKKFNQIFVSPTLSLKSDYLKEDENMNEEIINKNKELSFEEEVASKENLLLIGRKEIGKTSVLRKIALEYLKNSLNVVPIIIDLSFSVNKGLTIWEKMQDFLLKNSDIKSKICIEELQILLKNGNALLLIDNFDFNNSNNIEIVKNLIENYNDNRFIITTEEDIFNSIEAKLPDLGCMFKSIYIRTLNKKQIRNLASKWYDFAYYDEDSIVDNIIRHFNDTGMPRTPFMLSLVLSIFNKNKTFNFINEASVIQRFMEIILEKLSINEFNNNKYDFTNKEQYLMFLAISMLNNDKFYFDYEEYMELTLKYHKKKGFNLSDTEFDKLFFDKNILIRNGNTIYFRFSCILEYYIARAAIEDDEILKYILNEKRFLSYSNELCLYTGLKRDSARPLKIVEQNLIPMALESIEREKELISNFDLDISIAVNIDEIENKLKLTKDEMDEISDKNKEKAYKPTKLSKNNNSDNKNLIDTIQLLGRMIRNSEELDMSEKQEYLDTYMWCNIYSILIISNFFKYLFEKDMIRKFGENILETNLNDREIKKIEDKIIVVIPLAIQNMIVENIGSKKLEVTILDTIKKSKEDNFMKLMNVFLYVDLRLSKSFDIINEYIESTENSNFLLLVSYKLYFYYLTDYFPSNDKALEDLMVKTQQKIEKRKINKSKIISNLKNDKLLNNFSKTSLEKA